MDVQSNNQALIVTSSAFQDGTEIPVTYSCKGQNINPPLAIAGIPEGAKSLALIMHDPDAVNGDFTHWLMWDIPTTTAGINANAVPTGAIQGSNGSGQSQYTGPCPPAGTGTHHYIFDVYALDSGLGLPAGSNRQELEQSMVGHIIAQTRLTGLFEAD